MIDKRVLRAVSDLLDNQRKQQETFDKLSDIGIDWDPNEDQKSPADIALDLLGLPEEHDPPSDPEVENPTIGGEEGYGFCRDGFDFTPLNDDLWEMTNEEYIAFVLDGIEELKEAGWMPK